jgi:hypothetical protein
VVSRRRCRNASPPCWFGAAAKDSSQSDVCPKPSCAFPVPERDCWNRSD